MIFFKQRKNKQFKYTPRNLREQQDSRIGENESKLREERFSVKRKGNILTSLTVLIVLIVMVLILMYVLEGYINE